MVLFNYSTKELTAKVVYYGPGLCGKTTNLQWIHEKLPIKNKGKMLSLATETDRTLFFDFLPIELGTIRGMRTRIQLYTVPGQVFYNATRRMVLKGADCVVFVADSQEAMLEANLESLENLRQNLEANEIDADEIPMVLQYNKRDLPNALPIEILNERMNPRDLPFHEAVAIKGVGVEETLKGVTGVVFKTLASKYGGAEAQPASARAAAAASQAPAPAKPPAPAAKPAPAPAAPARVALHPRPTDELLEQLDLQPAVEEEEVVEVSDLDLTPPAGIMAEPEDLEVEELSFDTPPPSPANPKDTLKRGPQETEDLRRRISRPSLPEVDLTQLEEEEEEVDALSLGEPLVPEPLPSAAFLPRPAPLAAIKPAPAPAAAPAPVSVAPLPIRPAAPAAKAVAPSPAPEPVAAPRVGATTLPPVSVELYAVPGRASVEIPVEVASPKDGSPITIQLQLMLRIKLQS